MYGVENCKVEIFFPFKKAVFSCTCMYVLTDNTKTGKRYSFREGRYKSQISLVFTGEGVLCFIVHLLERSVSYNLGCGLRE